MSSALESRIDDLYRGPLTEFVAGRNALAKTVAGHDAQRVRKLVKPTVVPWAVNQVFWHARAVWDRVMKSGERLRAAQLAALQGGKTDVRGAGDAHRQAIADAVRQAGKIAASHNVHPAQDALMRTFEALSVATEMPEPPGRLTKPLLPAGFEALAGVKVSAAPAAPKASSAAEKKRQAKEETERRRADAAQKKHEAEVRKAEAALERARRRMAEAELALRKTRNS